MTSPQLAFKTYQKALLCKYFGSRAREGGNTVSSAPFSWLALLACKSQLSHQDTRAKPKQVNLLIGDNLFGLLCVINK